MMALVGNELRVLLPIMLGFFMGCNVSGFVQTSEVPLHQHWFVPFEQCTFQRLCLSA